jgi:hypothetical protein
MRYVIVILATVFAPLTAWAQDGGDGDKSTFQRTSHTVSADREITDLSGRWAQKVVNSSISKVPVAGKITTDSIGYLLLNIEQDADELSITSEVCDVRIDSSAKKVRTVVPDSFVEAIGEQTRRATLDRDGAELSFFAPKKYSTVGVDLRNPQYETLPEEPDDPRVSDADNDGHPGVTLRIEGIISGELYVIQRAWDVMRGTVQGHKYIDGLIDWGNDQVLLDSNSIFLRNQPPSWPHPNEKRSYFRTTRISDSATCNDVVKQRRTLFSRP